MTKKSLLTIMLCIITITMCVVVNTYFILQLRKDTDEYTGNKPLTYDDVVYADEDSAIAEELSLDELSTEEQEMIQQHYEEAEANKEAQEQDKGNSIEVVELSDDLYASDQSYDTFSQQIILDFQIYCGSYSMHNYMWAVNHFYGEDLSSVSFRIDLSDHHIFESGTNDMYIHYFTDGNRILAVWEDALYLYLYDCTEEVKELGL